jgi:hypothetical protein
MIGLPLAGKRGRVESKSSSVVVVCCRLQSYCVDALVLPMVMSVAESFV